MKRRALILLLLLGVVRPVNADAPLEYQVKAVCILNAARFVSWPANAFSEAGAPLVIGILGDNPFGPSLHAAVNGETIQGHPILVRKVSAEEAARTHVLFVSRSERDRLDAVLSRLAGTCVLTISELERFPQSGGMIGLKLEQGKIRFEINEQSARRANLKIGSQLLILAKVVK